MTRRRAPRALRHLPQVAGLWLLWLALWGASGPVAAAGGVVVAAAVVAAFRMPPIRPRLAPRPVPLLRLALRGVPGMVGSAAAVAWAAVRHGPRVRSAVIEVPLAVDSDLLITGTAMLTSLTPGSLVLEIDRERRLVYVHELPAGDPAALARRRRAVRHAERGVAHALGSGSWRSTAPGTGPEDPPERGGAGLTPADPDPDPDPDTDTGHDTRPGAKPRRRRRP